MRQWQQQEEQVEETIGDQHRGLQADATQATRHRLRRRRHHRDHDPQEEVLKAKMIHPPHQRSQLENKR